MMITLPFYMPLVRGFGVALVWFGIMYLLCMQIGPLTPPFGLLLFVLKGGAARHHRCPIYRRDPIRLVDDADDGVDLRFPRHRRPSCRIERSDVDPRR
jgi:hypothetical protein